ncbi:HEXXH motif-containing putative peptide modification protein [Pseudooceanicola sp. LIPI14-2-Ac024]|uniref:aKG-HExxH-type peptide beta-hydroxylase n=1 Tax=Pseudooceanicola sp. LIPI14-2-Ac024 TaxID=3344875 RepID=UPI0035D110CA
MTDNDAVPFPPPDEVCFAFPPDPGRARALDTRMHLALAGSLSRLAEALAAPCPSASAGLAAAADGLRSGRRVGPDGFARAHEIAARGQVRDLSALSDQVTALSAAIARGRAPFAVTARGASGEIDALMNLRMGKAAANFAPVVHGEAAGLANGITSALALMRDALPALHGEITGIVHHVVVARAPDGIERAVASASHDQFWGLMLLNPDLLRTPLQSVEGLVHEAAHMFLYGHMVDEPLVLNPDAERHPTPLTAAPSPMHDIFHATYVAARTAWAMDALAGSGRLTAEERAAARAAATTARDRFADGMAVIDLHGRLTGSGQALIEGARDWIRG